MKLLYVLFPCLALAALCAAITPAPKDLLARRTLAKRRLTERDAVYDFSNASEEFKRYHPETVDPNLSRCLFLLEPTVVFNGTSPRRRMGTLKEMPPELADTVRCMALWSHICTAVAMSETSHVNTVLAAVAKLGRGNLVDPMMWYGADPNAQDDEHTSMLALATRSGNVEAVETLILYGANPNWTSSSGRLLTGSTPNVGVLQALLDGGATLSYPDALERAIDDEQVATIEFLLNRGASPNLVLSDDISALNYAIRYGNAECVDVILRYGASLSEEPPAVIVAVEDGRSKTLEVLLDHGGDPNALRGDGASAVSIAVDEGLIGTLDVLLKRGANAEDPVNPLTAIAISDGDDEVLDVLLSNGANPNTITPLNGISLIELAVLYKHTACVRMLLKHGADPDSYDRSHGPVLRAAIERGYTDIVQAFLDVLPRFSPIERRIQEWLPHVVDKKDAAMLQILIARTNDLWRHREGIALLVSAIRNDDEPCVRTLLAAGLSPLFRTSRGETLLDLAGYCRALNAARPLLEKQVHRGQDAFPLLLAAVEKGDLETIWVLASKGALPTLIAEQKTRLMAAARATNKGPVISAILNSVTQ